MLFGFLVFFSKLIHEAIAANFKIKQPVAMAEEAHSDFSQRLREDLKTQPPDRPHFASSLPSVTLHLITPSFSAPSPSSSSSFLSFLNLLPSLFHPRLSEPRPECETPPRVKIRADSSSPRRLRAHRRQTAARAAFLRGRPPPPQLETDAPFKSGSEVLTQEQFLSANGARWCRGVVFFSPPLASERQSLETRRGPLLLFEPLFIKRSPQPTLSERENTLPPANLAESFSSPIPRPICF